MSLRICHNQRLTTGKSLWGRAMSEANKVKCSECGFLYTYDARQDYPVEAEEKFRETGEQWASDRVPRCFVRAHDLHSEIEKAQARHPEKTLEVITEERECDQFYPWRNGFTAKEHAHMLERDSDRKWQKETLAETRRFTLLSAAIGFVGAIVAAIITIMATALGAVISYAFFK